MSEGQRAGRFLPKPKIKSQKEGRDVIMNSHVLKYASCSCEPEPFPPPTEFMDQGVISACLSDDTHCFSSGNDNNFITTQNMPEPVTNEKTTDFAKISELDVAIPREQPEAVSEMPGKPVLPQISVASQKGKIGKRKATLLSTVSSELPGDSTSGLGNEAVRSLRHRTKKINTCQLVDESEEEEADDGDSLFENPSDSTVNENDADDDEEFQVKDNSNKKRLQRRSKPAGCQIQKPGQKRKQPKEVAHQSTKEPRNKFSHSTRRKRRHVNKVLLETPEDEIDFQRLSIRDLILLAEYKERILNKATTLPGTPFVNQSAETNSNQFNEDVTFTSEQGEHSNDEQSNPSLQETLTYINYQSFMDKAPSARWSKQDTELFFEAVRQFGSDFSMIQQLFPSRTRRQVKLKFKKEERQHPLRFQEALTNRSKDHTHFQLVIERLQQISAEEKQNSNIDDSTDPTCEDEVTPEADEVLKSEESKEGVMGSLDSNVTEFQSPEKSEDSDDDAYRWSNYKSEL